MLLCSVVSSAQNKDPTTHNAVPSCNALSIHTDMCCTSGTQCLTSFKLYYALIFS
jgi:hypothetical protein